MNRKAMIQHTGELIQLISPMNWHKPEKAGKYLESGMKPIEEFCNDIAQNLVCWAADGGVVFYRTAKYWYLFELNKTVGVVEMTRHEIGRHASLTDWANPHSVSSLGKSWLIDKLHLRVPAFNDGKAT